MVVTSFHVGFASKVLLVESERECRHERHVRAGAVAVADLVAEHESGRLSDFVENGSLVRHGCHLLRYATADGRSGIRSSALVRAACASSHSSTAQMLIRLPTLVSAPLASISRCCPSRTGST